MAVKLLKADKATDRVIQLFRQEAELLNGFDHPNIIKIHHLILLKNQFYLGMEFIKGGMLKDLMNKRFSNKDGNNRFSDREASQLVKSILEGIAYIHD